MGSKGGAGMRTGRLKKRLKAEQQHWRKESQNGDLSGGAGFMPGVIKGFSETLRILQEFQSQDVIEKLQSRHALPRWKAEQFRKACNQAYGRLKYGDRKK